ncbi:alpha-2-macroglobulin family protein [Membranihabitans marinus]|uniref:alpha-2-macroglobulin family protein n=1 Tax=Membranihabitans marinus TaxID=1227546 RepID=UPI001F02FD70|nr:MG2 domain-containing protein [Membranihabitans marinus]
MSKFLLKLPFAICFLIALLHIQCNSNRGDSSQSKTSFDPSYIAGFTSGLISKNDKVIIKLVHKVGEDLINRGIDKSHFRIQPNIEGDLLWEDEQTLTFIPKNEFTSGEKYDLHLDLDKILDESSVQPFSLHIQILPQAIQVKVKGMEAYNFSNPKSQRVIGELTTSDNAINSEIETIINAEQKGRNLPIRWNHEAGKNRHEFVIDSVIRSNTSSLIELTWDGNNIGADQSGKEEIKVPSINSFELVQTNVYQQPSQYIELYFSDKLSDRIDFKGLVYLKSGTECRLSKEGNRLLVYPNNVLSGEDVIIIEPSVASNTNKQLGEKIQRTVHFSAELPALAIVNQGVILPSSKGLVYPFKAINLKAVHLSVFKILEEQVDQFLQINELDGEDQLSRVGRVVYEDDIELLSDKNIDYGKWNAFSIDLSSIMKVEPGALYRIHLSFDPSQSLYPCHEAIDMEKYSRETKSNMEGPQDSYWNYYNNFNYENYRWQERDNPCHPTYYMMDSRMIRQNILASDLGIIAKGLDNNSFNISVNNILSTKPESDVKVEVYNYQSVLLDKGQTDNNGNISFNLSSKPFLLVASKDNQKGYLRLDDGSALSVSMFDVGGNDSQSGVKGYIYGERGVWRPGDSLFLTFVLEDQHKALPENQPVIFELYNPSHQLYTRSVQNQGINGFYTFKTQTTDDDPTGNWMIQVKVGGQSFAKTLKIETVKPNRLKILLETKNDIIVRNSNEKINLAVTWLHGAIAKGLKTDVELRLQSGKTQFDNFTDYSFDDITQSFDQQQKIIFEGNLDNSGKLSFNHGIDIKTKVPGKLKANYKTRVFEKSGDFSIDNYEVDYSPYSSYVGVKIPEGKGWNGALYSDQPIEIPIVTVDENGKKINRNGLKVEIFDVRWRWWWESSQEDDLNRYVSNTSENLISTDVINTQNGTVFYSLTFDKPSYGRKLIRITDPVSGHTTSAVFYVTYQNYWTDGQRDNSEGSEMLTFKTDKDIYQVGEEIEIQLPIFNEGRALISIENGSSILDQFWVEAGPNSDKVKIIATADMAPNAYLNVSLIQPHARTSNDLPIRLYGIQAIRVENPESHLNPQIIMEDELQPESKVTIKVKEENGRPMTYTLAVVDEGLLDLTRFKTPNPWDVFFAKQALGVRTWDMYKYVIGAYSGEMAGLLALGGDEYLRNNDNTKVNRFKPVVKFLGPFTLKSRKSNSHSFVMPNYVGSVRVMVVAGNEGSYGSAEKTCAVKKPLMVLASLPRELGPTEKLSLPVTVFAMDKNVKRVNVSVEVNDALQILTSPSKTIEFSQTGDQLVNFDLLVNETIGAGKVKVTVSDRKYSATDEIDIAIRASNPRIYENNMDVVSPGSNWQSSYTAIGMSGSNEASIEISKIPTIELDKRIEYLIQYPHGCLEQVTSGLFPQLYLDQLLTLTGKQKDEIQRNINAGIKKLQQFQRQNGDLSYWPGNYDNISSWANSFAGHFLLSAQEKGYSIPPQFLKSYINYQSQEANNWVPSQYVNAKSQGELIQAYRLFVLAKAGSAQLGAMNRLKAIPNLSISASWRLAGAYALIGKKEIALSMIQSLTTTVSNTPNQNLTYGSTIRDEAMILEVLHLLNEEVKAKNIFDRIALQLGSSTWYSTQSTAYALLAIGQYLGKQENSIVEYSVEINGEVQKYSSDVAVNIIELPIHNNSNGHIKINNTGSVKIFTNLKLSGIPVVGEEKNIQNDLILSTDYYTLDGQPINPQSTIQGQDIMVSVTVKNPGLRGKYENLALTQIFPSGWEIRNTRFDGSVNTLTSKLYDYIDFRDNRVYTYFNLNNNETKTFEIMVNASFTGHYYLPATSCSAMYDHSISAVVPGTWVNVVAGE